MSPGRRLRRTGVRLLGSLALLVLLSFVVFVGVDLLPGDPVTQRLGPTVDPAVLAEARARLGLDRPVWERYTDWFAGLLHGDLGTAAGGARVNDLLAERLPNSAILVLLTLALLIPLSLAIGLWLGLRSGSRGDRVVTSALLLIVAVPEFIVASLLVLALAVGLRWLPAISLVAPGQSPLSTPVILVLPVLSLLLVSLAYAVRVIRAATVEAAQAPHVEFLRINGFAPWPVLRDAVLPAVLPAAVQVWVLGGALLLGGAVLVETVVGYPGIGELLVSAVRAGDLPVVQGLVVVLGAVTLVAMAVADAFATRGYPTRALDGSLR